MLPGVVRLGGHVFRVRQVLRRDLPKNAIACLKSDANEILVYRRLPPSRKVECVLHEVVHAYLEGSELGDEVEEKVAGILGESFTQFLCDNQAFLDHSRSIL